MKQTAVFSNNSRGVALLAALLVLMVMSILAIGLLSNVDEDIKLSKNVENSERALKIAEAGIQVARSAFFDPSQKEVTETEEISSVDGFIHGGYFMAYLTSGIVGSEKWTQWRYNLGLTGNNTESEISVPLRKVWATGALGTNGTWRGSPPIFNVANLYGLVATGAYFPIETEISGSGDTKVRAHHEYTGSQTLSYWTDDKILTNTTTVKYAVAMSPMASLSKYNTSQQLIKQRLYFTYVGYSGTIDPPAADIVSTVRLRAAVAWDSTGPIDNLTANNDPLKSVWEFDTGIHGFGTAPTLFDPDPDIDGNEILYFVVIAMANPDLSGAKDLNEGEKATNPHNIASFPSEATEASEQIYLFAVVDTGASYTVKWAHPFPDPDVINWTDYPTEHVIGTTSPTKVTGIDPPYVSRPADALFSLPEDDLLADYRDGPGYCNPTTHYSCDNQFNLVRGNVFGRYPHSFSPPVVNVLYRDSGGNLTPDRYKATAASQLDPIINLYIMYSALTKVTFVMPTGTDDIEPWYGDRIKHRTGATDNVNGNGWGYPGNRKPIVSETRVVAIRDRLDGSGGSWNWNSPKSRFPTFKWAYKAPGFDPDQTDTRPWNGYGEYTWDTHFLQLIAPMIKTTTVDQENTRWADVVDGAITQAGGQENRYTVIYPYYKSVGFTTGSGYNHNTGTGLSGPTVGEGSPVNFSTEPWTKATVMMMAIRDTWDDYIQGNQTNPLYSSMATTANPSLSNPVEPYWSHTDENADSNTGLLTYYESGGVVRSQYPANTVKEGFPRPYWWSEEIWEQNVKAAAEAEQHGLFRQGWIEVIPSGTAVGGRDSSIDIDVEGETAAMCQECLGGNGLIVLPFNHDLQPASGPRREDLRLHGVNATTGLHIWDYHMAATQSGDNANSTPSIANQKVFVTYMMYNAETTPANRKAILEVLDIANGQRLQNPPIYVDEDADAVVLPPTIANGVVYVGTYDYSGPNPASPTRNDDGDDYIRLFALSPVLRLVSTGIYPVEYQDMATLNNYSTILKERETDYAIGVKASRRKLQVWVSGGDSKWEEVKDDIQGSP